MPVLCEKCSAVIPTDHIKIGMAGTVGPSPNGVGERIFHKQRPRYSTSGRICVTLIKK
jgi:hypothetical protein